MCTPLLAAAYFLIITPIGLLSRLIHDPLHRRWKSSVTTYWIDERSTP